MSVIVEKAQPIIDYLIEFKEKAEGNDTDGLYRQKTYDDLVNVLKTFKSELDELSEKDLKIDFRRTPKNEITKDIQYAMTMVCDEVIVDSDTFDDWHTQFLDEYPEFEFQNPGMRAQQFYKVHDRIGRINNEIKEFFYVCLALGFQGEKEDSELKTFKEDAISPLTDPMDKNCKLTPLAGECKKSSKTFYTKLSSRVYQVICAGLILLVLSICLWLRHDVTYPIEEIVQEIQKQQLKTTYVQ
jgi:hypothetical protein